MLAAENEEIEPRQKLGDRTKKSKYFFPSRPTIYKLLNLLEVIVQLHKRDNNLKKRFNDNVT